MTVGEAVLWPVAVILKVVWTAIKWVLEILGIIVGAIVDA